MLLIILIIACILVLLAYLVVTVRRHDKQAYADRDRDPFYSEMARLAAAGLLYEEEERRVGRPRHSYIVTPAGEAALRTWLREPMNDPGLLRLYFAGIVGPADVVALRATSCKNAGKGSNSTTGWKTFSVANRAGKTSAPTSHLVGGSRPFARTSGKNRQTSR